MLIVENCGDPPRVFELRVSRKVVRTVLRSEATEFHYEREKALRINGFSRSHSASVELLG
jgi:hypothetical protein